MFGAASSFLSSIKENPFIQLDKKNAREKSEQSFKNAAILKETKDIELYMSIVKEFNPFISKEGRSLNKKDQVWESTQSRNLEESLDLQQILTDNENVDTTSISFHNNPFLVQDKQPKETNLPLVKVAPSSYKILNYIKDLDDLIQSKSTAVRTPVSVEVSRTVNEIKSYFENQGQAQHPLVNKLHVTRSAAKPVHTNINISTKTAPHETQEDKPAWVLECTDIEEIVQLRNALVENLREELATWSKMM